MINVDSKVKNIYYMLCYSFNSSLLKEKDEATLGDEAFNNIYNLFSLLLCLVLKIQIKKGVYKDYNFESDKLSTIKGKINLNSSFKSNTLVNKKIVCEYDDYNENCLLNKVIKTTIYYLLKSNKIGNNTKEQLKKLSVYFSKVEIVDIKSIKWDTIRFNRNNISYKFVTDLCKLILKGLIVSDSKGNNKYKEFLDDSRVSLIYENFVKEYYRKHFPELHASSRRMYLTDKPLNSAIPMMKTDITLEYNDKTLIIDAKFYNKILRENYINPRCKTISNNNLYQIITYVDSQDQYKEDKVYGMLLYSKTIDEPDYSINERLLNHKIMIRTLDMNNDWESIKKRLNIIADCFKNDNFQ